MTSEGGRPTPLVLMIQEADEHHVRDYLIRTGFRVEEAHGAAQGLERALAIVPDVIVLDFGLDGRTVAQLRAQPATSRIPIIALTDLFGGNGDYAASRGGKREVPG